MSVRPVRRTATMGWPPTWLDLMPSIPSSSFQVSLSSCDPFKCTFWARTDKWTDRHAHKAKPIHPRFAGCKQHWSSKSFDGRTNRTGADFSWGGGVTLMPHPTALATGRQLVDAARGEIPTSPAETRPYVSYGSGPPCISLDGSLGAFESTAHTVRPFLQDLLVCDQVDQISYTQTHRPRHVRHRGSISAVTGCSAARRLKHLRIERTKKF